MRSKVQLRKHIIAGLLLLLVHGNSSGESPDDKERAFNICTRKIVPVKIEASNIFDAVQKTLEAASTENPQCAELRIVIGPMAIGKDDEIRYKKEFDNLPLKDALRAWAEIYNLIIEFRGIEIHFRQSFGLK